MSIIPALLKYPRLAWSLRKFLQNTITLEQSISVISDRLRNREKNFLSLVQKGIYQNPKSPYLKLLQIAGCEFGDIESLVSQCGIEATLQRLLSEGVYFSWEEFKGKKEVVRSEHHFQVRDTDFDNPFTPVYYQTQSSGSRSAGTRTAFDIDFMSETSHNWLLMLVANNCLDLPVGLWKPVFPAGSGMSSVLKQWKVGKPIDRWFSPVNEMQVQSSMMHRMATRYIIYSSRLWGARLARPEYVCLEEAVKVGQWMADAKKQFGGCCLICSPSSAVRLCQAAMENGLDIHGTLIIVSGEPLTMAKRRQIEAAGVLVTSRYTNSESHGIGAGCLEDGATDDVHLFLDRLALIQHQRKVEHADIYVDAFLVTTLLPSAPKIMLNVESDDYGVMESRGCGCFFGQLGFDTHIHDIRSFAKLTGSGMTIVGTDLVRILEEVLPGRYGGVASDYQLLEEEDSQGQTHLNLIISPTVGIVDESAIVASVLDELRRSAHCGKLAAGLWSQENAIQVKRVYPFSRMGKVMTLHLIKRE